MKVLILFIVWFILGLIGSNFTRNHDNGFFFICALLFFFVTIVLVIQIIGLVFTIIGNLLSPKKRYREVHGLEKEEIFKDSATEHITLNHPDYIGLLTKIDKKRIAEEYLEELRKEQKHGKSN